MDIQKMVNSKFIQNYKEFAEEYIRYTFPDLDDDELERAINYSLEKRYRNTDTKLINNYKNKTLEGNLLDMTDYILERNPIVAPSGCLFRRHGEDINPFYDLLETFIQNRIKHKALMYKYEKGTRMFDKYNLLQKLDKIDANGLYGAAGMYSCIYYNIHVASSITAQGRSIIAATILGFEAFLSDNVKCRSLDELILFIKNVESEGDGLFDDRIVLDENITIDNVMRRLFYNTEEFVPDEEDLETIWDILSNMSQNTLNRLFYKNNLYDFVDNKYVTGKLIELLSKMDIPYMDPNKAPDEIHDELYEFWDLLKDYVYYGYMYMDKVPRLSELERNVTIIIDTDSAIISLDTWYKFVFDKVKDKRMKIMSEYVDPIEIMEADEFGDRELYDIVVFDDDNIDYNLLTEESIERERSINPVIIIPQEGLRFSILNVLAFCLDKMINDYMVRYSKANQSFDPNRDCLFRLKNEYTFRRALVEPEAKKHYASIQDIQEGNRVPKSKSLAVSGMELDKSGLQEDTRKRLKKILYEEVLTSESIDQIKIAKEIAKFEKEIFDLIRSGDRRYYKPIKVKAMTSYDDPMRIQGIKASVAYNWLKDEDSEPIDLSCRNSIDIAKVNIDKKNASKIAEDYPETFKKLMALLGRKEYKDGIHSIALPLNIAVPEWLLSFIDYDTIISDNTKSFPIGLLGIHESNVNGLTNTISI